MFQPDSLAAATPATAATDDPAGVRPLIQVRGLTKNFPGVVALHNVDFTLNPGEVHVLVGENGAGKSSLVKVLCGIYRPDEGEVLLEGQPFHPDSPIQALRKGIRVVHQEMNLLPNLTVADNIAFEALPSRLGLVDNGKLRAKTRLALEEVGLDVSPMELVENLGIAQRQLVEIARALSSEARVLILDEPTATITPREIERLFDIIRRLKARGIGVLYISHHLHEMFEIGDRVTVLRNGEVTATHRVADVTVGEVMSLMVGRTIAEEYPFYENVERGPELLRVEGLRYTGGRAAISFSLKQGEILGIAGLVGSGRTETMRAIFGADRRTAGRILLHGREVSIKSPADAVRNGIGLLTEDRKSQGLILELGFPANLSITNIPGVSRRGFIDHKKEDAAAERYSRDLRIGMPSFSRAVRYLSGGNQQKVVVAKWLFANSQVLIFDEPTRGIDVGAKVEIYELMWELARRGCGVIMVSSDLPELLGVCHRIVVLSKGTVAGELERPNFSRRGVLELAYREYISGALDQPTVSKGDAA